MATANANPSDSPVQSPRREVVVLALLVIITASIAAHAQAQQTSTSPPAEPVQNPEDMAEVRETPRLPEGHRLMYTTYFYTAGEAVVHGYEADTHVRIVSMNGGQPIWSGTVGPGETHLVPTGQGVFGFLSDKKAAILVGTPSSCAVVGYWLRDQAGSFRSDHFFTQLPAITHHQDDRVLVWAWEDTELTITDLTGDRRLHQGPIAQGGYFELTYDTLSTMGSHILEFSASRPAIEVQVYYDEGFSVPSLDGRTSGRTFNTYVGDITEGQNDLLLVSYHQDAQVTVEDIGSGQVIWSGTVERGQIHPITLTRRYLRVTSDVEISVSVAPYIHYQGGYAEHHFNMGAEGTGIETEFLLTTPGELWVFSYFDDNPIRVEDAGSGQLVWEGKLQAGHVWGGYPGYGYFRISSDHGISVMGGAQACGAEFSPAAGLFAVDEALLAAIGDIRETRLEAARSRGVEITDEELDAPPTAAELDRAVRQVRTATGNPGFSADEAAQRLEDMLLE